MAKSLPRNNTYVYAHWRGMASPQIMGILKATQARSELIFSFAYDEMVTAKAWFLLRS